MPCSSSNSDWIRGRGTCTRRGGPSRSNSGTWELCESLEPLVAKHDAILLENHGVVTCGQDITTAYQRLEIVEQFARISLTAHSLGGPHVLSHANVQKLIAARPRYGVPRRGDGMEMPLTAESLEGRSIVTRGTRVMP